MMKSYPQLTVHSFKAAPLPLRPTICLSIVVAEDTQVSSCCAVEMVQWMYDQFEALPWVTLTMCMACLATLSEPRLI